MRWRISPKEFHRHHTRCGFLVISKFSKVMSVKNLLKSSFSPWIPPWIGLGYLLFFLDLSSHHWCSKVLFFALTCPFYKSPIYTGLKEPAWTLKKLSLSLAGDHAGCMVACKAFSQVHAGIQAVLMKSCGSIVLATLPLFKNVVFGVDFFQNLFLGLPWLLQGLQNK